MAASSCCICGESLCSGPDGFSGRTRSSEEILGYSGLPISSFVVSLGFGSIARSRDGSALSGLVCEACSILVFKLDVIFFDKDRCLEQLRRRCDQRLSVPQIPTYQIPPTPNAIFFIPTVETWPIDRLSSPKPNDVQQAQPYSVEDATPLLQELLPADSSGREHTTDDPNVAGSSDEFVDVEYWDSHEEPAAARRSFDLDVVGSSREHSDFEHICPSIFGRDGGGNVQAPGASPADPPTGKFFSLPKVDVPRTGTRFAELLTLDTSSKERQTAAMRPAKRCRKPENAIKSTDSILRGLLETKPSRTMNSPLFGHGFCSRSPGSSGSQASPDYNGFGSLGNSSSVTDSGNEHEHGLLTNFYASFLGEGLSDESHRWNGERVDVSNAWYCYDYASHDEPKAKVPRVEVVHGENGWTIDASPLFGHVDAVADA